MNYWQVAYRKFLSMPLLFCWQTGHLLAPYSLQWKMFFDRFCSGPVWSHVGALPLTACRELILNSSTDPIVLAMGCGYGLIATRLTIPLMEKWQRERERRGDCDIWIVLLIPPQSHGLLNYSLMLLLCLIIPVPQICTHISFFILTHWRVM